VKKSAQNKGSFKKKQNKLVGKLKNGYLSRKKKKSTWRSGPFLKLFELLTITAS
jgi:hypothetical protein